jgi:hypothetical protein
MPDGHESCYPVNRWTEEISATLIRISGMHSHTYVDAAHTRVIFLRDRKLSFKGSCKRIRSSPKGNAKSIADRLEDVSAVMFKNAAQERVMTFDRDSHAIAMRFPTLRRAFDIGKKKGDSAGR